MGSITEGDEQDQDQEGIRFGQPGGGGRANANDTHAFTVPIPTGGKGEVLETQVSTLSQGAGDIPLGTYTNTVDPD